MVCDDFFDFLSLKVMAPEIILGYQLYHTDTDS